MEDSSHVSGEIMRDLTSQGANSDENNDEEKPLDPDYVEERFRVDRRKLEHMIQAAVGKAQNAEDFFIEIMDLTNTQITWPSKLKIGAKSKKDPHIKVSGHKDAVAGAKEKIMAVLDTKSTRVTLKMDVSHTEHSHVIGKGGNNIKRVMHDTGCHIHFPDSNRNNQSEKSNQVSIAGQPQGVENAREKIRELLPLVFMFELQISIPPDSSSPTVQQIQSNYGVTVTFKQRPRSYNTMVIIRGSVNNAKAVKEATLLMMEQLTGGNQTYVSMQLEIAPQHHQFIIGTAYANIKQIMQRTGATIHFPDHTTVNPQRKGTVYITGPIDNVFLARNSLIGCLPLVLMFDMKEDVEIDQGNMSQLMEQLDVFISIKPKPKQPSKSVIVKSIERNAANLYEARRRLLGGNEESVSVNNATDSYTSLGGLQDLSLLGQNLVNMNANPVVMINRLQSPNPVYGSPVVVFSPRIATIPSQYLQAQNGLNNAELLQQQSALLHLAASTERVASGNTSGSDSPHGSPASCTSPPVDLAASSAAVVPNVSALLAGKSTDSLFSANHRLPNYHGNHVLPATTQGLQATKRDISAAAAVAAAAQLQTTLSGGQAAGPPGLPASVQNRLLYEQAAAGLLGSSGLSSPGTGAQGNGLNASGIQRNGLGADLNGDIQRQTMVGGDMSQVSIQEMLYRQSALNAEKRMSSLVDDAKLISRGSEVRRSSLGGDLPRSRLEMDAAPRQNIRDMKRPSLGAELERSLPVSLPQQMNFGTSLSAAAEIPSGHPSLPPGLGLGAADDIGLARNSPDDIAAALQATLASPTFSRSNLGVSELGRFNASLMASAGAQTSHNFNHNDMSPLSKMQGSSSFADSMFQRRLSPSSSSSDLFGSGHRAGSPHKTSPLGSPHTMPSSPAIKHRALLLEENGRNFPFQNGTEGRSSESGCDSDGSDHNRAPGSNRPWKGDPHSIFLADGMSVYDYEQKKLMATKAMQKKPDGESRIPTDYWAGLGFSKSMPDSAIRERLKQSNVRYNGPSMTTTFEESGDELQSPVQRDFPISPLPHRVANAGRDSPATPPLQRESQHPLSAVPGELPPHRKIVGEFGMASSNHMDGSSIGAGSSGWPPKTDLAELFSQIGLGKYTDLFTQQEIDLATFLTLTDQDLKELGISTFGARRKMILAIQEYNKRPALLSVAPGSNNPFRDTSSSSMMSRRRDIASVSGRW